MIFAVILTFLIGGATGIVTEEQHPNFVDIAPVAVETVGE